MGLVWTRRLSVGNAVIDSEHRNLISMTRDVRCEIRWGDAVSILQAIDLLESWLRIHFANEEKIAQAIRFPFDRHRKAQQRLLKEFQKMRKELAAKNAPWSDGAIKYFSRHMKNWIIDTHIVGWDMRMKSALQTHGYDFLPGCEDSVTSNPARCGCGCGCGCDGYLSTAGQSSPFSPAIFQPGQTG